MSSNAPKVLVVASYRDQASQTSLLSALAAQTFPTSCVALLHGTGPVPEANTGIDLCTTNDLTGYLSGSEADFVLFWPDDGGLQPAALEKLVIALSCAPDQWAVADASRGSTGLWLARRNAELIPILALWVASQLQWIEACLDRKLPFFYLEENLFAVPEPRRTFAVENCFQKLPPQWASLQPVAVEPLWEVAPDPDANSVLFLVHNLPMGGACKFILDVTAQLVARGIRVTVATTALDRDEHHPWMGELLRITPDVFNLAHVRPVEVPRLIVHLARAHRCGRVVLSHSMLAYHLLPWLRTQLPEVTFADYTHIEYETEWPEGGFALRSLQSRSLLDLAMVSSDHLREWMADRGAATDAVRVCHTNIDTRRWAPCEQIREDERTVLNLGTATMILYPCRLVPQKRPELLCNVLAELARTTKRPFVFVIAGDGALMEPMRSFLQRENLGDRVRILGAVPLERMVRLHNAADIFLLPSLIEGISLALFEAMALESVPVVADVGGQRELVTPACGELVPHGPIQKEVSAYVSALKFLIENPEHRREMAIASRERVETHFQLGQMAENFVAALDEAARRHATQPCLLPAPELAQGLAALAMDHVRVNLLGAEGREAIHLLGAQLTRAEKAAEKLTRQVQSSRPRRAA